jgi:hypothetical protein
MLTRLRPHRTPPPSINSRQRGPCQGCISSYDLVFLQTSSFGIATSKIFGRKSTSKGSQPSRRSSSQTFRYSVRTLSNSVRAFSPPVGPPVKTLFFSRDSQSIVKALSPPVGPPVRTLRSSVRALS